MNRKVWTAAELAAMDPAEVDAIFEDSISWDLADAPQELLARSRERIFLETPAHIGPAHEQFKSPLRHELRAGCRS